MMRTTRSGRQYGNNEGYLEVSLNKPPEIVRRSRRLEEQKKSKLNVKQETNFFSFFNVGFKRTSRRKARNEELNSLFSDDGANDVSDNADNGADDGVDDTGIGGDDEANDGADDVADGANDIDDDDSLSYSLYSSFDQNDYYFEDFCDENIEPNEQLMLLLSNDITLLR